MNTMIKVDRVHSVVEAMELLRIGVNCIGVSLDKDIRFDDDRELTVSGALDIKEVLSEAKLVLELNIESHDFQDLLSILKQVQPDCVQFRVREPISLNQYQAISALGCGIIYSGLEASYEDDPSWLFADFRGLSHAENIFFQIDLIPDVDDSWTFFKKECPKYPDELQVADINELAQTHPTIVTSKLSSEQIKEVYSDLPNVCGIAFILGSDARRDDFNYYSFTEVKNIIQEK